MSNIKYFMSDSFKRIGVVKNSSRSNIYPLFSIFSSRNVKNILYIKLQNVLMWKQSKSFKSSKKIIDMETNIVIFHIRLTISMISNSLNTKID